MEIRYDRDLRHNYMVLCGVAAGEDYRLRMLSENGPKGLLRCSLRQFNGTDLLYYEIDSRQPMRNRFAEGDLGSRDLDCLLRGIGALGENLEEYLLDVEHVLFSLDCIYVDIRSGEYFFVYCPFGGEGAGDMDRESPGQMDFASFTESLLALLDPGDEAAGRAAYTLCEMAAGGEMLIRDMVAEARKELAVGGDPPGGAGQAEGTSGPLGRQETAGGGASAWGTAAGAVSWKAGGGSGAGMDRGIPGGAPRSMPAGSGGMPPVSGPLSMPGAWVPRDSPAPGEAAWALEEAPDEGEETTGGKPWGGILLAVLFLGVFAGNFYIRQNFWLNATENLLSLAVAACSLLMAVVTPFVWSRKRGGGGPEKKGTRVGKKKGRKEKRDGGEPEEEELFVPTALEMAEPYGAPPRVEPTYGGIRVRQPVAAGGLGQCGGEEFDEETTVLAENAPLAGHKLYGQGGDRTINIPLDHLPLTVGKLAGLADFVIRDPSISRLHARFLGDGEASQMRDLNSTNGTFLNGRRLQPNETVSIRPGDEIGLGKLVFELR